MTDYATLQATVLTRSARSDLTALAPEFIRTAESTIRRKVRVLAMQTRGQLTVPDTGQAALPDRFLGFRAVAMATGPSIAVNAELNYMPPDRFHELQLNRQSFSGIVSDSYYTIDGDSFLLQPLPGAGETATVDVTYWEGFAPLSDTNTTNWLLTNHFDIYLWAALADLNDHIMDVEMQAKYEIKFDQEVRQLHRSERRKQRSGPYIRRPRFAP